MLVGFRGYFKVVETERKDRQMIDIRGNRKRQGAHRETEKANKH